MVFIFYFVFTTFCAKSIFLRCALVSTGGNR
ncbi:hypothetical protein E2C01_096308 [Portunus trituberculatus]|uniref:Uncharacterized protein n=1 Tax=Portunus trituberculatus TaxID=210409 RepID=A0A5B7K6J9_PORTR|nr:hypothetical protein [Portunus trituberculatus]